MDISNRGLELIKEFEGLELEAYQDIVGIWTIGYGHTSMAGPPEVVPGMEISEREATQILRRDLNQYENAVERAVKVDITQNMFDALTSITYNIGVNGMKNSTFIRRLNNGDYEGAAEAMLWWNKAGGRVVAGLKRRRQAEAALFLEGWNGDEGGAVADDPRGAQVEENSPRRGNLTGSRTVGGATAAGGAGAVGAGSVVLRGDDDEEATEGGATTGDANEGAEGGGTDSGASSGESSDTGGSDAGTDSASRERADAGELDLDDLPNCQEPLPEGAELTETELAECKLAQEQAEAEARAAAAAEQAAPEVEAVNVSTVEQVEDVFVSTLDNDEAWDAVGIAAGTVAVIAAIYVVLVRIDDWRNHKR